MLTFDQIQALKRNGLVYIDNRLLYKKHYELLKRICSMLKLDLCAKADRHNYSTSFAIDIHSEYELRFKLLNGETKIVDNMNSIYSITSDLLAQNAIIDKADDIEAYIESKFDYIAEAIINDFFLEKKIFKGKFKGDFTYPNAPYWTLFADFTDCTTDDAIELTLMLNGF